jgi:hypothetical protein
MRSRGADRSGFVANALDGPVGVTPVARRHVIGDGGVPMIAAGGRPRVGFSTVALSSLWPCGVAMAQPVGTGLRAFPTVLAMITLLPASKRRETVSHG